jgi:signal transduction histidine kinase
VQDSGVGGADLRAGTGLRGLAERVSAAGGTLLLSEASGHGTVLEVVLPCAP